MKKVEELDGFMVDNLNPKLMNPMNSPLLYIFSKKTRYFTS